MEAYNVLFASSSGFFRHWQGKSQSLSTDAWERSPSVSSCYWYPSWSSRLFLTRAYPKSVPVEQNLCCLRCGSCPDRTHSCSPRPYSVAFSFLVIVITNSKMQSYALSLFSHNCSVKSLNTISGFLLIFLKDNIYITIVLKQLPSELDTMKVFLKPLLIEGLWLCAVVCT